MGTAALDELDKPVRFIRNIIRCFKEVKGVAAPEIYMKWSSFDSKLLISKKG